MSQMSLTITPPEPVWVRQVSSDYPDVVFRILAAVPAEQTGFALARITGPEISAVVRDMDDHPQITELTPIQASEDEATLHFKANTPFLFQASQESGIVIDFPVVIQNGTATLEATGSRDRLSSLVGHLNEFGFEYTINTIGERRHESQLLSDRQLEFVVAALEAGYYDTPRRCSLTELADELGVAKSTCSETLHRAEETMIKHFVSDLPGVDLPETAPLEF